MIKNYFIPLGKLSIIQNSTLSKYLLIAFYLITVKAMYSQSCTINAGLNQTICSNDVMQLNGNSPDTYTEGPTWSQVSGPSVIISDPAIDNPIITGFVAGNTYVFRYAATCPNGDTPFQEVSFTVESITQANAGADVDSCPDNSGSIIINGNTPSSGDGESGQWSIVGSNNAGVAINLPNSASTPITLAADQAGTTTLRWTITGQEYAPGRSCSSFDDLIVTNYGGVDPVNAGNDRTLSNCYTVSQSIELDGSFGGTNINGQQGTWTFVSGPSNPTIANANQANTNVSNLREGTYQFRWDVVGPCVSGSDTVEIIVPAATQDVTTASIENDNIRLCDPDVRSVTLVGSDPNFTNETVQWTQTGGPGGAVIQSPTNSTTQITNLNGSGNYSFQYTITNNATNCTATATAQVRYNNGNISITVNSGDDIVAPCGTTSVNVPFTFNSGNQTQYSIISGPDDSALTFPTNYQNAGGTNVTINVFDVPGIYRVNFRRRRTGDQLTNCDQASDAINIAISATPSGSNAGSDQSFPCDQFDGNLAGSAINPGEQSVWTQVSGPNTATIDDIYAQTTPVRDMIPGTYVFRYTVTAGPNCTPPAVSDTTIEVSPRDNNPVEAGPNQTNVCVGAPVQLDADPPNDAQIGTWTSTDPGITFSDINDPEATATGFDVANTTYTLTWTLDNKSDTGCNLVAASDDVLIETGPDVSPTTAEAGTDQCVSSTGGATTITLNGNEENDTVEEGLWTVTPSAGVTFTDETTFNTTAQVPDNGQYTFTWTIQYSGGTPPNNCPATSDDVTVVVADFDTAVSAGTDKSLCLDPSTLSFDMDADPAPAGATGTWTLISGGRFSVDDENDPTATFSNLLDGTYVFEWTIDFGDCPPGIPSDQVTIEVGIPPTTASIQGGNQTVCGGSTPTSTTITADPPQNLNTEAGSWSLVSGPNSPNITVGSSAGNPGANNQIDVTGLTTGQYTFSWTIASNSPLCPESTDSITVDVFAPASAGSDQELCEVTSVFLEATPGTTGTWTQIANGAPSSTISQSPGNSNTANATVVPGNIYEFQFATDYGNPGCDTTDTVLVTVSSGPTTPPDAGPDQILCNGDTTTTTLAGNDKNDANVTATWSILSEPSGSNASITDDELRNTTVTGLDVPGLYILQWNFATENCSSEADIMRIEVFDAPTPVEAGANQDDACQQDIQLDATPSNSGIGTWSFANPGDDPSGGVVIIDSPNNPKTTLSNVPDDVGNDNVADVYVLTWTVSNGGPFPDFNGNPSSCNPQSDTVQITFTGAPPSPAEAGPDQELCDDTQTTLAATALTQGTGTWTQTAGPGGATIASPNNPNSLVVGLSAGTFEFTWTATGGGCTDVDTMEVIIQSDPVTAEAGPDQTVSEFTSITLDATPATSPATGTWTQVSGPTSANFIDDNDPTTQVTGTVAGSYVFEWTITNGTCDPVSDQVTITIQPIVDLELVKTVAPTAAKVGETVTFTVSVTNDNSNSSSDATGISVVDRIPNGYTLVPGTVSNSGLYNAGNLTITWDNINVTSGNTSNLTFDAVINETGSYINSAEITASDASDPDSTPNNNDPDEDDQDTAEVTITPNEDPVAVRDEDTNNTIGENVEISILTNDTDVDGTIDPASVNLIVPPGITGMPDIDGDIIGFVVPDEGTWEYNANTGILTFSPEPGFTGNPTIIEYTVRDDSGNTSNQAEVEITYTVNPPVANDDQNLTPTPINDPSTLNILTNDELADGSVPNPNDVRINLIPAAGTTVTSSTNGPNGNTIELVIAGEGTWNYNETTGETTFTPEAGVTDSPTPISYQLTDLDNGGVDTATITVIYQQAPVADDDASTANTVGATASVNILDGDTDADGTIDPNTVNLVAPTTNAAGDALTITNVITDLDGDIIGFTVQGEGTWSYSQATGQLEFDPIDGFTGNPTDVTYTVRDNDGNESNVATVNVEYDGTDPIANNDENLNPIPTGDPTALNILTNDELADGSVPNPNDVRINLIPAAGTTVTSSTNGPNGNTIELVIAGEGTWNYNETTGETTFTPEAGVTDSPTPISYQLTDLDNGGVDTATITVIYQQAPVADDDATTGNIVGATASVNILDGDTDADGTIDPNTVNLVAPTANAAGDALTITNVISDLDGDIIGFTVQGEGTWSYSQATGQLEFDPIDGFTGNPTDVTYTVRDNDGNESNVATVNVKYDLDAPVPNDDSSLNNVTNTAVSLNILTNDELADGSVPNPDDVFVNLIAPGTVTTNTTIMGANGTIIGFTVEDEGTWLYDENTGIITFTPQTGFTADPTPITYAIQDSDNNTVSATAATVTIDYDIQAPVALDNEDLGNIPGDTVDLTILINDSDADGAIDPESVNLTTPVGATNIVTDADGDIIGFDIPNQGSWLYDFTTETVTFSPLPTFITQPTPITYTVDDNDGNVSNLAEIRVDYVDVANLSLTKQVVDGDLTPLPGTEITFRITVTNDGPDAATGVRVRDQLPSGFDFVLFSSTTGNYDENTGIWNVGTIPSGNSEVLLIDVLVNEIGDYTNIAEVIASDVLDLNSTPDNDDGDQSEDDEDNQVITPVQSLADISLNKTVVDNDVNAQPGDEITFQIVVTNDGPDEATGIQVRDVLPQGFDFILFSTTSGTYDENTGIWNVGTVPSGFTQTLLIDVLVNEPTGTPGEFINIAEVIGGDQIDPDSLLANDDGDQSEDDEDRIQVFVERADLSLEKSVNTETPNVGETITFTLQINNEGPDLATGVSVEDTLPIGFDQVTAISNAGSYEATENKVEWNNLTVPVGGLTLTFQTIVQEPTLAENEYVNIAQITASNQFDPDSSPNNDDGDQSEDDEDTASIQTPGIDVEITKEVNDANPSIGDEILFTITASNSGTLSATNLRIEDRLPTGYQYISHETTSGTYNENTGIWEIPSIADASSEILTITVEVLDIDDYVNVATLLDLDQIDGNPNNDSDEITITTVCLNVYNEFTPNNDGTNDFFYIDCIDRFPGNKLIIYNRWGNIVYQKQDYDNSWQGTSNGRAVIYTEEQLPVGTYYYTLDLNDGNEPKSGWIYLNR